VGGARVITGVKTIVPPVDPDEYMCGSFVLFRTEDFDRIGGYNPFLTKLMGGMDDDFIKRMEGLGCLRYCPDIIYFHPDHGYLGPRNKEKEQGKNIVLNSGYDPETQTWTHEDKTWHCDDTHIEFREVVP
jgi:GT2 family glycosyltransferase